MHQGSASTPDKMSDQGIAKQPSLENFGRDERIRTSDPHTPSVMRYQAALRPDRRAALRRMMQKLQALPARLFASLLPDPGQSGELARDREVNR